MQQNLFLYKNSLHKGEKQKKKKIGPKKPRLFPKNVTLMNILLLCITIKKIADQLELFRTKVVSLDLKYENHLIMTQSI